MKCKNHRIRRRQYNQYGYCVKYKKEVPIYCKCENIEYKEKKKLKQRSNKQNKAEKNRYSILYHDLTKCCHCGSGTGVEKNEIYSGAYRQLSIKHGMVAPFCQKCHKRFHSDRIFNLYYKVLFQIKFLETHTLEEFLEIFKIDYKHRK